MKKIAFVLAAAGLLGLAACEADAPAPSNSSGGSGCSSHSEGSGVEKQPEVNDGSEHC